MTAPARRPQVVLFDLFETCLQLEGLRPRFAALGRPEDEVWLFFARLLHQGMAMTLAGEAPPFATVAADMLRRTSGRDLTDDQVASVLDGFRELPVHPDVAPALRRLGEAGVPAYGFTHGSAEVAGAALEAGGVRDLFTDVMSCAELKQFKPPPAVYHWACDRIATAPARTALVAVHSWDVHGAIAAGLLGGFCERLEGRIPDAVARPHVAGPTLEDVVEGLLALPDEPTP
ncbi:HAD family hydrolase [Actinomycetospora callitridis]|jgi:2-haloacid dehalogenase|uniref:HAD family hydrolase n=1 Tax=Actinomycetospora callitridis TaxID=913944 RepID=UPI002365AC66|nr:HAD family hydrolase [Actinomycetospora callitridis]MDD7918527.1 haloacid dehalogenase [Actinomycetospora callitridis]